ncbi:GNAT family N-acetyltransferase [Luteolibacter sp. LG18]|uniref:GNAT family N-acetyltransferase n=1 Tax=Luteolibacter sp. LG18 TaxID=2819286 RepID=UPI0030C7260E
MTLVRHSLNPRTAEASDAPAILTCQREALRHLARTSYAGCRLMEWADRLTESDLLAAIERHQVHVLEDEESIAAFAELDESDGHIPALFVHPRAFRRGFGTALMETMQRHADGLGLRELTVSAATDAVPFYERQGFTAAPERLIHFPDGISLTYIPMRKELARAPYSAAFMPVTGAPWFAWSPFGLSFFPSASFAWTSRSPLHSSVRSVT